MESFMQRLTLPRLRTVSWGKLLRKKNSDGLRKDSEALQDDVPLVPTAAVTVVRIKSSADREVADAPLPITSLLNIPRMWLRVALLWFGSDGAERWEARGWAAAVVVLSFATTLLLVQISYLHRDLDTAMSGKDKEGFYLAIQKFALVILVAAPLFALADFIEQRLVLEWRRFLTRQLLEGYYSNRAFFRLHMQVGLLDNPDQRICDDVPSFTDGSVTLSIGAVRKLMNVVAFSGVLWSVAPSLVLFLLAYAAAATGVTVWAFARRLMQLHFRILRCEGDLRFDLVRTRENSEAIAFYRGERREEASAVQRLLRLVAISRVRILWSTALTLWTHYYSYATILVPSLLTAPRYFRGEVEFGVISQVGFSFNRIESALSYLVNNLGRFSGLAAQTERLDALFAAVRMRVQAGPEIERRATASGELALEDLTVLTPGGERALCQGLSMRLEPGMAVLVMGPSGCGKSSLLRALAGLWTRGGGFVAAPAAGQLFFLPQKPFMPLGTLRQQLLFPTGDAADSGGGEFGSRDEDLLARLEQVLLPGLAERVGGLDADLEWAHVLSLGEQQRIAFLRLLLHGPALAFLDEATGALDSATEAVLYGLLKRHCRSYVSVGHRAELLRWHTHVLQHVGGAHWRFCTKQEFLGGHEDASGHDVEPE